MKKLFITICFVMLMPVIVLADDNGICGENASWSFVESTGTLTISGEGAMFDYQARTSPWMNNQMKILSLVVEEGISHIGEWSFCALYNLKIASIPNSLISIGKRAFSECNNLSSITIPSSVTDIGNEAFAFCNNLNAVNISDINAWCNISFADKYSNPLYLAHHIFINGDEIKNIDFPSSVLNVKNNIFAGGSGLNSINLHDNITSIGNYCCPLKVEKR